ncbi:hypothetical protein U14_04590 [Candidatus Moduliflexus flocculans]|uniref:Uncharacterized protein n=1 Tax=Candidatus Moduliflexus flocculans TaxID=1499966 RepID=A0A0S6W0T6_9BACT|nr:hypothetical protein U14_04590 [Candidatus Moduliflexus flocculans]
MAWTFGTHFDAILNHARRVLSNARVLRCDSSQNRAILDFEGTWGEYRIIVSEIHRVQRPVRYAYYVLNQQNQVVHAFDNSPDNLAIKLRYHQNWKAHLHEEIPHQHDADGNISLTASVMTFEQFVEWLQKHLT